MDLVSFGRRRPARVLVAIVSLLLAAACSSSSGGGGGGATSAPASSARATSATSACLTIVKALGTATAKAATKIGDRAGLAQTYAAGAAAVRKAALNQPAAVATAAGQVADALDGLASKVRAGGTLVPDVRPLTMASSNLRSACA